VARTSTRNFSTAFRSIGVDDAAAGPDVSEDIQLVYIADDLRQTTYIQAGSGGTEAAAVGENGFLSLECRTARGLEVEQITMSILVPADGVDLRVWTSGVVPTVTGIATMITALRTTGLQGLPAAPESIASRATIPTANIPADAFRYVDVHQFAHRFFINSGQFFNVAFPTANLAVNLGIRWRELRLYGG